MFGEYTYASVPTEGVLAARAYAKVNLALCVGRRRADGYHPVATVLQSLALHDTIHIAWRGLRAGSSLPELSLTSDDLTLPVGTENLAGRALAALAEPLRRRGVGGGRVEIHIEKRIPVAAGLAGGSADAAAVLHGCNQGWGLGLSGLELEALGASLGSDVPAMLRGGTLYCQGRGERLTSVACGELWWVLANPGGGLSAGDVYRELDLCFAHTLRGPELASPLDALLPGFEDALAKAEPGRVARYLTNDLEAPANRLAPVTRELTERLRNEGALAALVSGSGPTVAALVDGASEAERLAERMRSEVPWVWWGPTVDERLVQRR